jgi:hypothetical protein
VTLFIVAADSTGAPVPAARVMLSGRRSVLTDSAGHLRIDGLEPGPARVRVSRIGYVGADTLLTLPRAGEIHLSVQLRAAPVAVQAVTATGVPDSTFVGTYNVNWHAQQVTLTGGRLQVQRHGERFAVTWFPAEGRAMAGDRVRVRGRTLSFTVTGRSPVQFTINVNEGRIVGRWEAMNGESGRLTGEKSP